MTMAMDRGTIETGEIAAIAGDLLARAEGKDRFLVAIAGPPGAGKSTFAEHLARAIRARGESAEILPMDGFHLDDAVLREKGLLARKGAPETFDVRGLIDILAAIRAGKEEVFVPVFDRSRELSIASARAIEPGHRIVLVEGNYLLLDHGPWRNLEGVFDHSIFLSPAVDILESRLMARWLGLGLGEGVARSKVQGNDLPNGRLILDHCRRPDRVIASWQQ